MLSLSNNFMRFLLAGGVAAAANIGSRVLLSLFFSYKISIVISFAIGMTVAFLLMRIFVFTPKQSSTLAQTSRFIIVNLLTLILTILISINLNNFLLLYFTDSTLTEAVAHSIGVLFPVFTSYFAHKLFTFD
jgi:putative flippase GtrA